MYHKFDVTRNLFLHSALFNGLNTASVTRSDRKEKKTGNPTVFREM
jgi:hypothetical protein